MGILSHELRDPLSTIRLASALLLREGVLPKGLARVVQRADDAADRMARLVGNILDFTHTRFLGPLSVAPVDADIFSDAELWQVSQLLVKADQLPESVKAALQ